MNVLRVLLAPAILVCLVVPRLTAAPMLQPLREPALWRVAEFRLGGVPSTENNFDPDVVAVDAEITAPSGARLTVPAFWFQDFERREARGEEQLVARGEPEWRLRYTPTEPGEHRVAVRVALAGQAGAASAAGNFTVKPSTGAGDRGWARIAADRRSLETSDGKPLRLLGENVCWSSGRGTVHYDHWFASLAGAGQNFARLWMAPWWAAVEQTAGTRTRYRQEGAWQLDHVFALAERHGIYLLFCLDFHGMFMINDPAWGGSNNFWPSHPYAVQNGGPCAGPNDFFTDARARELYRKRLRYLIARYGSSPQLLAWQFFNEIDNSFQPRSQLVAEDVLAWHADMARWLKAHDPFRHLVTTSLTGGVDRPEFWNLPEMDFSSYHSYADPAPARTLARLSEDFLQRYKKPVIIGEFGVSGASWARPADPHLRGFRQAQWGAVLAGSVGNAMSWWWEELHVDGVYPVMAAQAAILRRAGWERGAWQPARVAAAGPLPEDVGPELPEGETFPTPLTLNSFRRLTLRGSVGVADLLCGERASEYLSSYLRGTAEPARHRPIRLAANFGAAARLVFHIDSVAGDADLAVRLDGADVWRETIKDRDGKAVVAAEINREVAVDLPAGHHVVELVNTGREWAYIDALRLQGVRTSALANGARHEPEAYALRQGAKAVVYVTSPHNVHPAGAHRYRLPVVSGRVVTLLDWTDGPHVVEWYDPETGRATGRTTVHAAGGELKLALPAFSEDLVAVVGAGSD